MDLAGTVSRTLASIAPGRDSIQGYREFAGTLERARSAAAWFRAWTDADRPGPRDGIQNAEVRRLQQSSLGIDAAPGESRELSPRTGHYAAAATWRTAHRDGPDALLSRACHGSQRVDCAQYFNSEKLRAGSHGGPALPHFGNDPNHCLDEGSGAASARGEPHRRARADDGRSTRGAFVADRAGAAGMLAGDRFHFCKSETVWAQRGFFKISSDVRKRQRKTRARRGGFAFCAGISGNLSPWIFD